MSGCSCWAKVGDVRNSSPAALGCRCSASTMAESAGSDPGDGPPRRTPCRAKEGFRRDAFIEKPIKEFSTSHLLIPMPNRLDGRHWLNMYASRILCAAVFALALVTGMAPMASATTVIPPDFGTMVKRAEIIFRGKVTNVRSEWSGTGAQRCIVSYVTFDLIKVLKGEPSSPYVLKMLGGTVGDDGMAVSGAPKFAVGDTTLLFVEHNGTQFIPLVGIMHGYFRMERDPKTGDEIVLKSTGEPLRGTAEIDREHQAAVASGGTAEPQIATATAGTSMKRSDFETAIARAVKAGQQAQ